MKLNHVTLIVSDFERSVAFYRGMGFVPIVHAPPRYARLRCPEGDATLSVEVTGDPPLAARAELYFECADVDATAAALERAGYVFTQAPTDMSYLWREARLRDPDGHDIRLYHAGSNRLDPPWKVKV
jgi:catechol 2,3-dioxygenase-like lactoylglutathione lyase family enzyme